MARPDILGDAKQAVDTIAGGGITIMPGDVGYGIVAGSPESLRTSFNAKGRAAHKRHAMIGNDELHRDLHLVEPEAREIIDTLTIDYGLPLGVVARYRADHPLLRSLDAETLATCTVRDTISVLVNNGRLQDETAALSLERSVPLLGSSANISGTGPRFRIEDIQDRVRSVADIEFDYGLRKYHLYRRSSTMIDFTSFDVIRIGACYDVISDVLARRFDISLPADPGYDALPSGHLHDELA